MKIAQTVITGRTRGNKEVTNLSANSIRRRPQSIIFLGDFTVVNDPLQLLHHTFVNICLVGTPENAQVRFKFVHFEKQH